MIDLKKEKCEVENLMLGMYVTELDRPWIGTPFMLQGFLLDNQADIDTIMSLCQFVYIDRTKSAGKNRRGHRREAGPLRKNRRPLS